MDTISETLAPNISSATDASVSEMQQTHTDRHLIVQPHRGSAISSSLHAFYAAAVNGSKATALWRLPSTGDVCAVVDLDKVNELTHIDFHRRHAGFVFAPFVTGRRNAAYRIDADVIYTPDGLRLRESGDNSRRRRAQQHFAAEYARYSTLLQDGKPLPGGWYAPAEHSLERAATEDEYTNLVRKTVDFIRAANIAKVVVSRTTRQPLPEGFDAVNTFLELAVRYPTAFVSLVAIPGIGTWLGASPEVLLTLDGEGLTTMALAGTQRRPENRPLAAVEWGHKEAIEQEMVSDYVRDFFVRTGVTNLQEEGPRTVAAANVVHLQSLFRVELPEHERLALANRVLDELHPTSAVCGMPKHRALAFILEHEGYDRRFYSGFLGPVHMDGQSSLYVNLRCMQLDAGFASLYVGGGITAESDPSSEWRETEMKAETMLSVLRQPQ
jgi:isochorismate synthase